MIQIYYVPIEIQTLLPLSVEDVKKGGLVCVVKSRREAEAIIKLVNSGNPLVVDGFKFQNKTVRVVIVKKSKQEESIIAVVENTGCVKRGNGDELMLTRKQLDELQTLVESQMR